LTEYLCDPEEPECKINIKITPLLEGLQSSQLTCSVISDFEFVPTTDSCNPNTSVVPEGEHDIEIKILDAKENVLQTSHILIKNPPEETIDPSRVTLDLTFQQPTYLLEKEDISKEVYTCDPSKDECKVNILVSPKLDGAESSQLACRVTTDF
jgi:hypothetical protein